MRKIASRENCFTAGRKFKKGTSVTVFGSRLPDRERYTNAGFHSQTIILHFSTRHFKMDYFLSLPACAPTH